MIIVIIVCVIFLILLKTILGIKLKDLKEIKQIGFDKNLNEITNKLPENKEVCEQILKKLNNTDVKIKEDENSKTSLYIAVTNTICIADIKDTFMRIQTIAHECLHSIQDRKILLFNFIYSNIYLIYFITVSILTIFRVINNPFLQIFILTLFGFVYYIIRSYLEMEVMIKAEYLAEEYMKETNILTSEELEKIMKNYKMVNKKGIKLVNFQLILSTIIKIIIYSIICIITNYVQ